MCGFRGHRASGRSRTGRSVRSVSRGERAGRNAGRVKVARDREEAGRLDESFERFLQEYEIVRGFTHPNIVRIYDLAWR